MKQIISLSLKYIKRQKLRTTLTFLCVTLSVFILCSMGAYMGSILQTLLNQAIEEDGSYEASIGTWLDRVEDKEKAVDIIANHAAVSEYFATVCNYSDANLCKVEDGKLTYIEFSDGKNTRRLTEIHEKCLSGNSDIVAKRFNNEGNFMQTNKIKGVSVPYWLRDYGYSVGDTVTFTLTPVRAKIDKYSPEMQELRKHLEEDYTTSLLPGDVGYDSLDKQTQKGAFQGGIVAAFKKYDMSFEDIPLKTIKAEEPVEITIKIDNFINGSAVSPVDDIFSILRYDEINLSFDEFFEKYPETLYTKFSTADIRISDDIDFDEGMIMLYGDLGFKEGNYYSDLPFFNDTLLMWEFRNVGSIVQALPFLGIFAVILFLAWLVARFVIDNAFEISSQERSSQFAALRIMGASKSQIVALVFVEAFFYTITAIPIGTITAYALCSTSFFTLRRLGFSNFEFRANPYFVVGGIVLCILAVFISAYTSAMWAAGKLSPAEALNFGKPKKKEKKLRKKKSKIKLNSKQFLRRYTSKNIMRSKSRYIISTVTMTFSVMFFTFSLMLGIFFYTNIKEILLAQNFPDYSIAMDSAYMYEEAEEAFRNNDAFREAVIYAEYNSAIDLRKTNMKAFQKLFPYEEGDIKYIETWAVDRAYFDENIAELSGMTYDQFAESNDAIFFISDFGSSTDREYDEIKGFTEKYDRFFNRLEKPLNFTYKYNEQNIKVTAAMCSNLDTNPKIIIAIDSELAQNFKDIYLCIRLWVNGRANYEAAEKCHDEFIDTYKDNIFDDNNAYAMATGLDEFVGSIAKIVISLIASVWAVGVLSMVNSINTSVLNRSRELMMLRSIGMSKKQLRKTVMLESVMFSAFSSSLGTIAAIGGFFAIMSAVNFKPEIFLSMAVGLAASVAVNVLIAYLASLPALHSLERAESLLKTFE